MTNNNPTSTQVTRRFLPVWLTGAWGALGIAAGLYLIPYLAWFYFHWGGEANAQLISDLACLPLDLLTALAAWRVATQRQLDIRLRRVWLILGLAMFSFLIADLIWLYLENFLEVPPFPSAADVFYLAFYPLVLWGLLSLPGAPLNRRERWEFLLNLFIVMTVATMFVWYFVIVSTAAANQGDFLAQVIAVAYPIGDLVVLGGIIAVLFRRPDRDTGAALLLFLVGIILFVAADMVFLYTSLNGTYETGGWVDSGWVIASAFFIWAALRQLYVSPASAPASKLASTLDRFTKFLPFLAVGFGYGLVLYLTLVDFSAADAVWLFIGAVALTILVISRQVVSPTFAHLSLRVKLVLAFLAVVVLSLGVVTLVVNQVIRTGLTEQGGINLHALAEVKAQQIAELLDRQLETLKVFGLNPIFRDVVEANRAHNSGDPAALQEQIRRLDLQWDVLADNDPLVSSVLGHKASLILREFQQKFPGFIEMFVTNQYGELVGATQRTANYDYSAEAWWQAAYNQGEGSIYIGQPEFNNQISAVGVIMAVPVRSRFDQKVIGVLRSTYSLAALTEGLASARVGQTGHSNLLLPSGQILYSDGRLEPVEPATLAQLNTLADAPYDHLTFQGESRLVSQAPIVEREGDDETELIQQLNWKLLVDQNTAEALAPAEQATQIALLASLGALLLAVLLAMFVARLMVKPITRLTTVAAQIAGGDFSAQAAVEARDEIGRLAATFNTMTGQLRQTLARLERRTQALATNAEVSHRLSTVLDQQQLMAEVVEQVQNAFNYYHTQIYLLDEPGQNLVLTSATGEAGQAMLARGHTIPVGKGLVGRAAAKNAVVLAPNLARMILPEVVTQTNIELIYRREADPALQTGWYHDDIDRTFVDFEAMTAALTQSARPLKLGYVLHFLGDFTQAIKQGAEDAARDLGLEIEVVAPGRHGDKIEAVSLFEQMVQAGKDGLVVIPELEDPWPGPFSRAAQAGIPVVTANSTGPQLAAWPWFGQDGYQSGFILANEFKKFLLDAGHLSGVIVLGACTTAEVVISARYEGFKKGLENSGYTITPLYETTLDPQLNYQTWAELVKAQPDLVAAVGLSAPDVPSLAKIKQQTNAAWLIAGYDLVVETLEAIKDGLAQVVIGQHPYLQGYLPVLALAQHLREGKSLQDWMVEGWLPNPLLPDTKAEISVPINLEDQVVGVLDVQVDKVDSLDETDADILRSLANQVAVAIRNARQFTQVQAALDEAGELQRRYVEQSWDRTRVTRKNVGRVQFSLGESASLDEAIIGKAQQQALMHKKPTVVNFNDQQDDPVEQYALVAPILLRDIVIGDLQLHESNTPREWTESELALISAVVDQVAQAAETLRLLDETQERASREQLISQISNKMRRAPDLESLLKVAVTELSRALNPARTFVRMDLPEVEGPAEVKLNEAAANGKPEQDPRAESVTV
ncbi:MAG: hypothetical protein BroJett011_25350 [Chloroflexota bacterium]|nr:MAG: hypothetical protein BroJett011_25350 [Chloroflexota bacterium]